MDTSIRQMAVTWYRYEVEGVKPLTFIISMYIWNIGIFHCKDINVYECPVTSCSRQFNFKWRVKPHLKNEHHTPNNSSLYENIAWKSMLTKYYKDPCNTTPRKFVKVNVSDRGEAALARRRYAEHHKIDFPHLQARGDNQGHIWTLPSITTLQE